MSLFFFEQNWILRIRIIIKVLKGIFYGLIFGFASPVPGVSSGSVAVFLNVYDKIFSSLSFALVRANLVFTISFLIGWFFGLFGFSNMMMLLFENYGQILSFCFLGFVIGCVPAIIKKATVKKFRLLYGVIFLLALAFMLVVAYNVDELLAESAIEQLGGLTPSLFFWLLFTSFVSASAMLIPGVGGSLMMLIFGIYTIYIEAVATLNMVFLSVLVVGMILGVFAGIVITKKLLKSYSQALYCAILAFIIGSLFIIYPGFSVDLHGLLSIVFAFLCAALTYWLSKKDSSTAS